MFCLSFDADNIDQALIDAMIRRERLNALAVQGYLLLWRDNGHVQIERTNHHLRILMDDPIAGGCKEHLRLDLASRLVSVHRPWPGSRSIYFRLKSSFLITTHLRLATGYGATHRPAPRLMNAGGTITFGRKGRRHELVEIEEFSFDGPSPSSLAAAARQAKSALREVMGKIPRDSVILLSGGIDSAAMAASAPTLPCLTWTTPRSLQSTLSADDTAAARRVAGHLSLSHEIVSLNDECLRKHVDAAVLLSETRRGTFIDDAVVYVEIARQLMQRGVRTVFIGEAADDAFGCLPYNLRYYQGDELLKKLRRSLMERAPADFAAMTKIFNHFGITLIDPYLSLRIASLGFRLPLEMRVDAERLMKPVLRKSFANDLPLEIVQRTKRVSRDISGVRDIMAEAFGIDRERFLNVFTSLFLDPDAPERQTAALEALEKS